MSPRSPDSLSDGEIVSGDEEKAIHTTARTSKDSHVNTSARLPPFGSSSRAAQPLDPLDDVNYSRHSREGSERGRRSRESSRSPYRRDKSRSRSPYRVDRHTSGEKRKHDDDHYSRRGGSDPRRFKVHYEEDDSSRSRRGYKDLGRPWKPEARRDRDDAKSGRRERPDASDRARGNRREQSRSPPRYRKGDSYQGNGLSRTHADNIRTANQGEDRNRPSTSRSSDYDSTPEPSSRKDQPSVEANSSNSKSANGESADRAPPAPAVSGVTAPADEVEPTLSEAELIEQRRRRREAIKARHKSAQPLLVQALEQNLTSAPATPLHDTSPDSSAQQSPPSSFNSPRTPQPDSAPGSPAAFAVNNDEDLVEQRQAVLIGDEDGPSAADYDPNMDMQEDRPDHKKLDLTEQPDVDGTIDPQSETQPRREYDMFADDVGDDDDDDMFAPADAARKPAASAAKQARALDESLLDNWDYPDGHYRINLGELLDGRYAVQQQIGKGTFATVVRATDTRDGTPVAVKIACNNETMYKAGQKEMDMLELLNQNDPEDKKHIIRLIRQFEHKGHLCLVFENLSADLREVLKKFGRNVGLNLKAIRSYAQQMFLALSHMKKCQILHADLKPDNMLVSEKRNLLKVCDLGTASFAADAEITPYLVSRFYRAPEVILGMPFDHAIDMWSIGCTLFELYTGRILFAGADNNQMLRAIQECRGKFPLRMLKRASLLDKHFDANANFYSQERDKITGKPTVRQMNFNKTVPGKDLRARLSSNLKGMRVDEIKEHSSFVDLMEKCLQLDPARRITPNEALRHSFITHGGVPQHTEKAKEPVKVAMNLPRLK